MASLLGLLALTGCPTAGMQPPPAGVAAPGSVTAAGAAPAASAEPAPGTAPTDLSPATPGVSRFFAFSGIVAIAQRPVPGATLRVLDAATGQPVPNAPSFPAAEQDPMGVVSQTASAGPDGRYRLVLTNPRPGAVLTLVASDGTRTVSNVVVLPGAAGAARYRVLQTASREGDALGARRQPWLTAEEQVAQAEATLRRGVQLSQKLTGMLSEARRDKDVMRINCLNRKLAAVNALVSNSEPRIRAMQDAVRDGDEGRRQHEATVLSVTSEKLNQLDQEAALCLGQALDNPGDTRVDFTPPSKAPEDSTPSPSPPAEPPSLTVPPPRPETTTTELVVPVTEVTTALTIVANQVVALANTGRLDPEKFTQVVTRLIGDLNPAMQTVQSTINANPALSQTLTTGGQPDAAAVAAGKAALNTALEKVTDVVTKGVGNAVQEVVTQTRSTNVLQSLAGQTFPGTNLTIEVDATGQTLILKDHKTGQVISVDAATGKTTTTTPSRDGSSSTSSNFNPKLTTLKYVSSTGALTLVASQPSGPDEIDVATVAARLATSSATLDTGHATSTYNPAGFVNPIAIAPSTAKINVPSADTLVNLGITTATADAQAATSLTIPADFGGGTLTSPDYAAYMVITEYNLKIARFQVYKDRTFDGGTWHLVALTYNLNDSLQTHHGNTTTLTTKALSAVQSGATADVVFVSRYGQVKKQLAMPITIEP